MKHTHKYEPLSHRGISPELANLGIEAVEIRKCRKCGQEMPFLLTKKGGWVPLYEEAEGDQQDILMA